jgi:putative hydrolase of the HAD superfamily
VLFDLGGTLIETESPPTVFKRILTECGHEIPLERLARLHASQNEMMDNDELALKGIDYWVKWNTKLLTDAGVKGNVETLARKIDKEWFDYAGLRTYPDTLPLLKKLKTLKIKTGIVTNGLKRDYQAILDKLNLTDYFNVVVGVDDCKKAKPHKEIFQFALAKINVNPNEALFIGDSVKYDYQGAKNAGIKPLLISRNGKAPENIETITSLNDVLKHLKPSS